MQRLFRNQSVVMVVAMLLASHSAKALLNLSGGPAQKASDSKDARVTAVAGESWLLHLNRSFSETSMGKTGHLGPAASEENADALVKASSTAVMPRSVTLHGADLYRMNCQGCHGESGEGAPPEINSVINPVRATSIALVMERMKATGMEISHADAARLAQQANTALLQRLHNGGQNMPPFPHLEEAEIRSLFAYLRQLAGVAGAEGQQVAVTESPLRVGEHIVKSTCHTCHSATGANPDPQQIWDGAIPPLAVLTARKSQAEFIRKVTHGAPILMGTPPMLYRGRMPVFYYLSEQEAADVYLYLTIYPPSGTADQRGVIALSRQAPASAGGEAPPPPSPGTTSSASDSQILERPQPRAASLPGALWISTAGSFVLLLLAGGLGFTLREFQRLSARTGRRSMAVNTIPKGRTEDVRASLQHVS